MQIGEMAKRSGFSRDTLRYYEKIGLIRLGNKQRGENNYRIYDEEVLSRLALIKKMKAVGFTLNQIKELMRMEELDMVSCPSVGEMVKAELQKIDEQIRSLEQKKSNLEDLMECCEGDCMETIKKNAY